MISRTVIRSIMLVTMLASTLPALAQNILTVRSAQDFEKSMTSLHASLESHGYKVSHVQLCDSGLTGFGYETDRYRVVFFGKLDEVRQLSAAYPELIPFLPLKIAVFAEGETTLISSINPVSLGAFYRNEELDLQFRRWESDLRSILSELQHGASSTE